LGTRLLSFGDKAAIWGQGCYYLGQGSYYLGTSLLLLEDKAVVIWGQEGKAATLEKKAAVLFKGHSFGKKCV